MPPPTALALLLLPQPTVNAGDIYVPGMTLHKRPQVPPLNDSVSHDLYCYYSLLTTYYLLLTTYYLLLTTY